MASLAELRAKSQANLSKLREKTKEGSTFAKTEDTRIWKLDRGKDGNAFAIIRFLPISKVDEETNPEKAMPWVKIWDHSYKNETTGRWYIDRCRSTIGQPDPVYENNRVLYALKTKEGEAQASKQKRKLSYYSNILVIKDGNNPENEGKVKLFRYGPKIHDKIKAIIEPSEVSGDASSDPCDFWSGRDFRLEIRTVDDYPNYDLARFTDPKPIADKNNKPYSEDEIDAIWSDSFSLLEFLDPKNFKSYDELKKRFDWVEGRIDSLSDKGGSSRQPEERQAPKEKAPAQKAEVQSQPKEKAPEPVAEDTDIDLDALLEGLDD